MRDKLLKEFISRKTRVQLINHTAMADVPGVRNLKNRNLTWKEFTGTDNDLPPIVSQELSSLVSEFNTKFHEFSDQQYANTKVIFAYYASNPTVSPEYAQTIEQSTDPQKDKYLELIQWMNKYGVRLFLSPKALMKIARDRGQRTLSDKSNSSDTWLENFGYIWGLGKIGDYRHQRDAYPKSDEEAERILSTDEQSQLEESGKKLVQVVTSKKNGAWGIYFSSGDKLFPVIGDNYYQHSKSKEDDHNWVEYDSFGEKSGQHSKYFGVRNKETGEPESFTYPTSSRFLLANGEDDPEPKFVHKNSIKNAKEYIWKHDGVEETLDSDLIQSQKGNSYIYSKNGYPEPIEIPKNQVVTNPQQLYYLWIKNDGTLWWVPNESRREIRGNNPKRQGAEKGKPFPLTKEQVDHLSLEKGKWFVLTNPDKFVYSWDTLPEHSQDEIAEKQAKIQDWKEKTQLMDDLYDFLSNSDLGPPSVNLQATKYCIVGPRFKEAENTGIQETKGRMKSHHTHVEDMHPGGSDMFYGVRKDWVVVGNEFNQARAESRGSRGLHAAQSIDGLGPVSGFSSVQDAVQKAFTSWGINAPLPDQNTLEEAQEAFEHAISGHTQNNILPQNPMILPNQTRKPNANMDSVNTYIGNDAKNEPLPSLPVLADVNCLTKTSSHLLRLIRRIF